MCYIDIETFHCHKVITFKVYNHNALAHPPVSFLCQPPWFSPLPAPSPLQMPPCYLYLSRYYLYLSTLPALQIQSTYPVSSRSSRCDSLSAMKPARDSTLSFSFANSLNRKMSSSVLCICLIGFSVVLSPLPPSLHCFDCIVSPDPETLVLDTCHLGLGSPDND